MRPYFERDGVTLYHATCLDLLAIIGDRSVEVTLTDPPYTERVHANMRSNKGRRGGGIAGAKRRGGAGPGTTGGRVAQSVNPIDFPPLTQEEADRCFAEMARVTSRWLVATVAFEHAARLYEHPPAGHRPIRVGAWVKVGPTPQMTGDRPAQGWEAVSISHAEGREMRWNGGGKAAVWHFQAEMRGKYPTQKPEPLIARLLADFAESGDVVLDPFCGAGTTALCAWRAGHRAISCDVREEALEVAARRLSLAMDQGRLGAARRPQANDQAGLF